VSRALPHGELYGALYSFCYLFSCVSFSVQVYILYYYPVCYCEKLELIVFFFLYFFLLGIRRRVSVLVKFRPGKLRDYVRKENNLVKKLLRLDDQIRSEVQVLWIFNVLNRLANCKGTSLKTVESADLRRGRGVKHGGILT